MCAVFLNTSQVTSIQLEWEKLSELTGDPQWARLARRAMLAIHKIEPSDGLYPMFVHPGRGNITGFVSGVVLVIAMCLCCGIYQGSSPEAP